MVPLIGNYMNTKMINKVQVTWDGQSFQYVTPQGMTGKGLTAWKKRNAKALTEMRLETPSQTIIGSVRVVRPSGTDRLTYHIPQGMTGMTFTQFKQDNAEAIIRMKGGYNVSA